ncbi:DGQHR domain-containing protein [Sphingobacterium sp. lm-10]|uniref:DNA sulfur modification protein DndB n=1 Tax=Sphingobacterium sp. lm-10 TaxID=2944904 RepID=UPI00201FEE37|nr:DNA sulfur modification protein DndB [Sphingobacterium sp. lm-10]MCL7987094.1 DGQHR domain-containing protein [Sphingobacterium sp. lm-10]
MKIPALRAELGGRTYYIATLTFQQVNDYVERVDDELHKSESLKDLIQRSITNNYMSIKDYILHQDERFFNSLILAVYDDYPTWSEVELRYDDQSSYQVGLLDFPAKHKIFPVDGQHRVEGIKAAIKENPKLKEEKIAAIFIGHKNDANGKQSTRRLFTTLNRYAKPVSFDDTIALDEDDTVAIVTRELLEEHKLFQGKRIIYAKQKAIPSNNFNAITSIITLYQCNIELFKAWHYRSKKKKATAKVLAEYLKFRKSKEEIADVKKHIFDFWNTFCNELYVIQKYLKNSEPYAKHLRNNENGGHLLFRPVGLLPFIKAISEIQILKNTNYTSILSTFNKIDLNLSSIPWQKVVWDSATKRMIMNSSTLTQMLMVYKFDSKLISGAKLGKLEKEYASKIDYDGKVSEVLKRIK